MFQEYLHQGKLPEYQSVQVLRPPDKILRKHGADVIVADVEMRQFGANSDSVAGKIVDPVPGQTESPETFAEAKETIVSDHGDVVVGEIEITKVLELVKCS